MWPNATTLEKPNGCRVPNNRNALAALTSIGAVSPIGKGRDTYVSSRMTLAVLTQLLTESLKTVSSCGCWRLCGNIAIHPGKQPYFMDAVSNNFRSLPDILD
jgi:hypothetical protein